MGDGREPPQPGLRGQRPRLPLARGLRLDERERPAAVHDADPLLPAAHAPRGRTAADQLQRRCHGPAAPGVRRRGAAQLLGGERVLHAPAIHARG